MQTSIARSLMSLAPIPDICPTERWLSAGSGDILSQGGGSLGAGAPQYAPGVPPPLRPCASLRTLSGRRV